MQLRGALVALAVLLVGVAPAAAAPAATVSVLVVDGRGWGHGVGMAQDGALSMARAGATTPQIIGHFYPGTTIGKASGDVRVVVQDKGSDADLTFPSGGEIRDARDGEQSTGFPVNVPAGGTVHLHYENGRYTVDGGEPASTSSSSSTATTTGRTGTTAPASTSPTSSSTTSTSQVGGILQVGNAQGSAAAVPADDPTTTTTTSVLTPVTTEPPTTTTTAPPATTTTTVDPVPTTGPPAPTTAPSTTSAPPTTAAPGRPASPATTGTTVWSPRSLWAVPAGSSGVVTLDSRSRSYRGVLEAAASGSDLRLLNQLDVETYLRGMGEVRNPSWPPAALRTQAIAARTYALRAMAASGEICDYDRCQVYLGAQAEYSAMDKVVADSAHQVVMFGKGLASTVYSANAGGFSATPQEGFGSASPASPYLQASPYKSDNPMPWSVKVALSDVGARFGYKGQVQDVRVAAAGPSGRALTVEVVGDNGVISVPGTQFASRLGLRSTLVDKMHTEAGEAPPPPPPADSTLQALPDQAAALAAADAVSTLPHVQETPPLPDVGTGTGTGNGAVAPKLSVGRRAGATGGANPLLVIVLLLLSYAGMSLPYGRLRALIAGGSGDHFRRG